MYKFITHLIKYLIFILKYKNTKIGYRSVIIGSTDLGKYCTIGHSCSINNSKIGNQNIIEYKCKLYSSFLGDFNKIYNNTNLSNTNLGRYNYIGIYSQIGFTNIGSFCSIGPYFTCNAGNHPTQFLSTSPVFYSTQKQCGVTFAKRQLYNEFKITEIGNDVWIGSNVIVRSGVNIGDGAVIGTGSVVTKDIPPYTIVVGNPAKPIKTRFDNKSILQLLEIEWWNWPIEKINKALPFFTSEDLEPFFKWIKSSTF